ncbi:hypothetical protein [Salarchaeum sp. JOR-1]|uniref:hypothetical protein n=1 Tax=Salarchaeum sp. JOR-1 TaxID=2599399 RepID=UPI0011989E7C|nr:hypothetical protein [Salarchaeum sp. JOR-1]QDX40305.1 hypothetical protein FQU85_05115 [Salarchaeum sp. JOR-1]
MGGNDDVEACGRCAITTVTDAADADSDPYEGERIEVDEDDLRSVSGHVRTLAAVKERLNEWATRVTYSHR